MLSFFRHLEVPLDPRVIEFIAVLEDKGIIPGSKVSVKHINSEQATAFFRLIEERGDEDPIVWFEDYRVKDGRSGFTHGFGVDLKNIAEIELA